MKALVLALLFFGLSASAAVTKPHAYTPSVQAIYQTTAPTTWAAIDVSSHIGASKALLFLRVSAMGTGTMVYFRRAGQDSGEILKGVSTILLGNNGAGYVITEANENGVIEWKATDPYGIYIYLIGYVK